MTNRLPRIDSNNNKILGTFPTIKNSSIEFMGKDNVLYCDKRVVLTDSNLKFKGNNSLIYLCSNINDYKLNVSIFNNSVCHIGKNNYFNQPMTIILSEQKHCFIGNHGVFSLGIWLRNADPHLIYDSTSKKRMNTTQSIYIGDHVWIGQSAMILKNTKIDSGSIIGAMSVVAGKIIPHNTSWAGNPCKQIRSDIFWDRACVHDWTTEKTELSQDYSDYISSNPNSCQENFFIYNFDQEQMISWENLEKEFSRQTDCLEKCTYLNLLNSNYQKNRFVHF